MAPFVIFVGISFTLRGMGALGIASLSSWQVTVRLALAAMFVFTGVTHFTSMKYDYAAMIPEGFPTGLWVYLLHRRTGDRRGRGPLGSAAQSNGWHRIAAPAFGTPPRQCERRVARHLISGCAPDESLATRNDPTGLHGRRLVERSETKANSLRIWRRDPPSPRQRLGGDPEEHDESQSTSRFRW
jgi:hypothetical protein